MKKLIAPALLALTALAGSVLAQTATDADNATSRTRDQNADRTTTQPSAGGTTGQSARSQAGAQASQSGALDQHIAVCLTLGNQEEVALGQFAQDRAEHPQVKQFAQMMAEEHQQAIAQLKQAAPQVASMNLELTAAQGAQPGAASQPRAGTRAGAENQTTPDATASATGNQRASATGAQGGQHQKMAQFAREVKQECLNLTQAELGRKQGAEFDKAYIGQQLVAHTGMLAELRAAQRHASENLQPIIQQGTQMTEHHLAQARQIMQQLDNASEPAGAGAASRPSTNTTPRR